MSFFFFFFFSCIAARFPYNSCFSRTHDRVRIARNGRNESVARVPVIAMGSTFPRDCHGRMFSNDYYQLHVFRARYRLLAFAYRINCNLPSLSTREQRNMIALTCFDRLSFTRVSTNRLHPKGPRKRGNIVVETLLRKHVSLNVSLFARERNICCGNFFVSEKQKSF